MFKRFLSESLNAFRLRRIRNWFKYCAYFLGQNLTYVKLRIYVITEYFRKNKKKTNSLKSIQGNISQKKTRSILAFFAQLSIKPKIDPKTQNYWKNKRKIKSQHILIRNYKYTDYSYNFTWNFYAFNFSLRHFS